MFLMLPAIFLFPGPWTIAVALLVAHSRAGYDAR